MEEEQAVPQNEDLKLTPEEQELFQKKMEELFKYYQKGGERGIKHSLKFNKLAKRARKNKKV